MRKMRKFILLSLIFPFLSSCSHKTGSKLCHISDGWIENKFNMSKIEEYINVTVNKESYEVLGYEVKGESELLFRLDKVRRKFTEVGSLPPHLFLRSDKSADCFRFRRTARLISSSYPCGGNNLCIWAYGSGVKSMPLGVPSPPTE